VTLKLNFHSGTPVYKQLVEAIGNSIRTGEVANGDKLPPIRKFAEEYGINPNTVAKVYRELELAGLIKCITGSGCIAIASSVTSESADQRQLIVERLYRSLIVEAKKHQISERDMCDYIAKRRRS
jgi:GntR family transcriptional regulator